MRIYHLLLLLVLSSGLNPQQALASGLDEEPQPQLSSTPLSNSVVVLRGLRPKVTSFHDFGPPALRVSDVSLRIKRQLSNRVQTQHATFTVSLDGVPMKTYSLHESDEELIVNIGRPGPGYHALTLSAHLTVEDEDCQKNLEEIAWMKLVEGELSFLALPRAKNEAPVNEVFDSWAAGARLIVRPPLKWTTNAALAYLEAVSLLRVRGAHVVHDDPNSIFSLRIDGAATESSVRSTEDGLTLLARDDAMLLGAVRSLRSERLTRACIETTCFLGPLSPKTNTSARPQKAPDESIHGNAFTLAELQPRPWIVSGAGKKSLSFTWVRPQHWTVTGRPELTLKLRLPQAFYETHTEAIIQVELNDVPLDSWILSSTHPANGPRASQAALRKLQVSIPQSLLEAPEWNFRVTISLRLPDQEDCTWVDPLTTWLLLEQSSGLSVSRQETTYRGIFGFYGKLKQKPALNWQAEKSWPLLAQTVPLLDNFILNFPRSDWRIEEDCDACLIVRRASSATLPLKLVERQQRPHWQSKSPGSTLPLVPAAWTALLFTESQNVVLALGPAQGQRPIGVNVDWARLRAPRALLLDSDWLQWGEAEIEEKNQIWIKSDEIETEASLPSDREQSYLSANLIWLALLMLIASLSVWWMKREKEV